jgi:RNA polymerase sigma-54 factor
MNALTLQARAVQTTAFSPKLQHAVRLLQMSSLEFARCLHDEAQSNPFLEVEEAPDEHACEDIARAPDGRDDDSLWAAEYEGAMGRQNPAPSAGEDALDALQGLAVPVSLRDHLHAQLGTRRLTARERVCAQAVADAVDEDGYLRVSLEELAVVLGESGSQLRAELERALAHVQACDPCGVGARTVSECLCLQLAQAPASACRDLCIRLATEHLELLASRNLQRLSKAVGASLEETREAVQRIRRLNAHPGWQHGGEVAAAVTPDVTVRKHKGVWATKLNASALPRVQLNHLYAALADSDRASLNPQMAGCLEQARWTVSNVNQRLVTILQIARAIVSRQTLFLEYGPLAMKPLGLREIADEVGVHPSTVSRTVRNKYMATPWGMMELRRFFSRGMEHSTGRSSAPAALKELLSEMIGAESTQAPLSDAELTRLLAQQGFSIARRTVTKYRQGLGVDPVERRRSGWNQM